MPLSRVLTGHLVFTVLNAVLFANLTWLMPMLVRLHFGSDDARWKDWQTTFITAAIPTFLLCSVFWGELLRRVSLRRYLVIYWLVTVFPLGCVALVNSYGQLLGCHVVSSIGLAGWAPLNGKLLKHFYSDAIRGRMFGLLNAAQLASGIAAVFLVGRWLETEAGAFRVFFIVAPLVQLAGMGVLAWLVRHTQADGPVRAARPRTWSALLEPVLHMGATLRADRMFLRYEIAFMTYGAAYMFCEALLPVLATDRFGMGYETFSHSTQLVRQVATLAMIVPMGWLLDRIGPVRTSGISFGVLAGYPLLLLLAHGTWGVGLASGVYGFALAGVMMGWMLGPVTLAPSPERVPEYVAIHTTLVGVRGLLCQGFGMLLYKLTGGFAWPLVLSALAFLFAAGQMWRLQGLGSARASVDVNWPVSPARPADLPAASDPTPRAEPARCNDDGGAS